MHNSLTECKPQNLSAFEICFFNNIFNLLCVNVWYTSIMDLSVLVIDDEHKVNRVLENTNLNEYEPIDLPMEQLGDSSH